MTIIDMKTKMIWSYIIQLVLLMLHSRKKAKYDTPMSGSAMDTLVGGSGSAMDTLVGDFGNMSMIPNDHKTTNEERLRHLQRAYESINEKDKLFVKIQFTLPPKSIKKFLKSFNHNYRSFKKVSGNNYKVQYSDSNHVENIVVNFENNKNNARYLNVLKISNCYDDQRKHYENQIRAVTKKYRRTQKWYEKKDREISTILVSDYEKMNYTQGRVLWMFTFVTEIKTKLSFFKLFIPGEHYCFNNTLYSFVPYQTRDLIKTSVCKQLEVNGFVFTLTSIDNINNENIHKACQLKKYRDVKQNKNQSHCQEPQQSSKRNFSDII